MSLVLLRCLSQNPPISELSSTLSVVLYPHDALGRCIRLAWWSRQLKQFAPEYHDKFVQAAVEVADTQLEGFDGLSFTDSKGYAALHRILSLEGPMAVVPRRLPPLLAMMSVFLDQSYEVLKDDADYKRLEVSPYERFVIILEHIWASKWDLARDELIRCCQFYCHGRSGEFDLNKYYSDFSNGNELTTYSHYDISLWVLTLGLIFYNDNPDGKKNTFSQLIDKLICSTPEWIVLLHDINEGCKDMSVQSMLDVWILALRCDPFLSPSVREIILEFIAVRTFKMTYCMSIIHLKDWQDFETPIDEMDLQYVYQRILNLLRQRSSPVEYSVDIEKGIFAQISNPCRKARWKAIDINLTQLLRIAESVKLTETKHQRKLSSIN